MLESFGLSGVIGTGLVILFADHLGRDNDRSISIEYRYLVGDSRNMTMLQGNQTFRLDQNLLANCRFPQHSSL